MRYCRRGPILDGPATSRGSRSTRARFSVRPVRRGAPRVEPRQRRGARQPASQPGSLPPEGRGVVHVEDLDFIGRGVVQAAEEPGVVGDVDAAAAQPDAHVRHVENGRGNACIRLAGMTAAGTAIETGGMGIVDGRAAVPGEQHQACEWSVIDIPRSTASAITTRCRSSNPVCAAADGARFNPRPDPARDPLVQAVGVRSFTGRVSSGCR